MAAPFRQQLRRGFTGTAVAAAVMATVAAAQGPQPPASGKTAAPLTASGGTSYYTEAAPPPIPDKNGLRVQPAADRTTAPGTGAADIPATVLAAYRAAEAALARSNPGCHLPWQLLAAIGKVESVHARGGRVDSRGTARPPILGPQLNGNGFAAITDTDNGAYDGDISYDRAVGPMQFIPSTWARWGSDGNNDGRADPNNVFDAALAAGNYLCAGGRDLAKPQALDQAILSYNYSTRYLATVKSWFEYYKTGFRVVPDGSGPLPPPPDSGGSPASPGVPLAPAPGSTGGSGTPLPPQPGSTVPAPGPSAAGEPAPTPSPSDSPTADPTATETSAPDPTPTETPTADPTPTESPTADPPPTESPTPSESPSASPSPSPSGTGAESSTPTPSAESGSAG